MMMMIWMAIRMTPRHLALYYIVSFLPVRPHTRVNASTFPQMERTSQALSSPSPSRSPGRFPGQVQANDQFETFCPYY
jgi:hypothetical protein